MNEATADSQKYLSKTEERTAMSHKDQVIDEAHKERSDLKLEGTAHMSKKQSKTFFVYKDMVKIKEHKKKKTKKNDKKLKVEKLLDVSGVDQAKDEFESASKSKKMKKRKTLQEKDRRNKHEGDSSVRKNCSKKR